LSSYLGQLGYEEINLKFQNFYKKLKEKGKDLDYKTFNKKLFQSELSLKDKNVNIDELIKRLDNFVL